MGKEPTNTQTKIDSSKVESFYKILLAEDDRVSSRLLKKYATQWGYEVIVAHNGGKAWSAFQNNDIGIAILDWMMPQMSGIELCQKMRSHKSGKYTYIILLTSKDSQDDINQGLSAGADDYITKPFNIVELKARLKTGKRIIDLQEKLRQQAIYDDLTGLYNRTEIFRILLEELERCRRETAPLGIIMLDIDHFKDVNDTYGHPVGDEVLTEISRRLKSHLRRYDKIGRIGGEEFLIILPNNTADIVNLIAERHRRLIDDSPINTSAGSIKVTISLGCRSTENQRIPSIKELIKECDDALYRAKHSGRNCVVSAEPS